MRTGRHQQHDRPVLLTVGKYLDLLVTQMQHDADVLSSRWMYTGVLLVLYVIYASFKWYVLLMPITMPLTVWGIFRQPSSRKKKKKKKNFLNN